jgi:acetyl esterase/lipase
MRHTLPFAVFGVWAVSLTPAFAAEPDASNASAKTYEVKAIRDLAYYDGPDASKTRHKLDLYLPKDAKDFPVVLFVHGGAWKHGDKSFFGVYSALGRMLARNGIGAVLINYRLSPEVMHPEHVKDVARAFAWTHKHIDEYGGGPDQIFVCGHSAGGHLVALLATDETYLKAECLSLKDVKGVMSISGVYSIPDTADLSAALGLGKVKIEAEGRFSPDRFLASVFGKDPETRTQAFPLAHVKKDLPPFLILWADHDIPTLDKNAEGFVKALKAKDVSVESREIAKHNHMSIIIDASVDDDRTAVALRDFVHEHIKDKGK